MTLHKILPTKGLAMQLELEPEPELVARPTEPQEQSCLKAIGLITGTDGRVAKLISWFPADGSTAASGLGGAAKPQNLDAPLAEQELEWFGLPRDELASLLAPAAALCDTDFDLQVDSLRFIGRPTIIGGANSDSIRQARSVGKTEPAQPVVSEVERVSPRRKRMDSQTSSKRLGEQDESTLAEYGAHEESREVAGERRRLKARSKPQQELLGTRRTHREREEKEAQRIFHVVFVIDSRKLTGAQGESVKAWQTLAAKLTSALLLEEKRSGYIEEEIATMRRLREEHSSQDSAAGGISEKPGPGSGGSVAGGKGSGAGDGGAAIDGDEMRSKPKPLAQQFLEHSDLARVLEALYRGLVSPAAGAGVLINGWIRLDLYVDSTQPTCNNAAIRLGQEPEVGHQHQQRHHINPDQSYMLLRPKQVVLAELPSYASPAVRAAIERANPCLSVYTLAESMSISVDRLVTVLHQLVRWKVVRVIEKFDSVFSRFIAAPSLTVPDLQRFAPQFVAAQLLATMRAVSFGEGPLSPGLDRELEVGASLAPGEPPLLTEEAVSEWVSTLGVRRAAVRLLAIPLMYQAQKRATNDVDYRGPYMDSETQESWWIAAHAAVADPWLSGSRPVVSNGPMRPTRQLREALLAEIQSDEQILMFGHTLPDQELRAAGRFSVFLTAVRRVLDDIKQTRHVDRQWEHTAFVSDLVGNQRAHSPANDEAADANFLPVEFGICEVLAHFGTSLSMANVSPSQHGDATYMQGSSSSRATLSGLSSSTASDLSPKSISDMTVGPLADGRVWRSQQDVVRLLTWLLQKDVIVPVFEHYYLCIPATKGGMPWTTSEDDDLPQTPTASSQGTGWESGSSTSSLSSMKTDRDTTDSADTAVSSSAGRDIPRPSVDLLWAEWSSHLQTSAHPDSEVHHVDGDCSSTVRIAQAAGLSAQEFAVLQSLQNPALGRARDTQRLTETRRGRARAAPPPTDAELRVFLGWCPMLRGGCRSGELMKVTQGGDCTDSRSDGHGGSSAMIYRKQFVEHVLDKFAPCLVTIVHEAHTQLERG